VRCTAIITRLLLPSTSENTLGASSECPFLAQSRHVQCADECPLLGAKRKWRRLVSMSA